jgi:hypothetical protein
MARVDAFVTKRRCGVTNSAMCDLNGGPGRFFFYLKINK